MQDIDEQLKNYPDPPPNPEMEIMKSLAEFTIRVKDRVTNPIFLNNWDARFAEPFKKSIIGMKPKFNVREFAKSPRPVVIDLESDSPATSPTIRKRPAPVTEPTMTQGTPKRPRGAPMNGTNGVIKTEAPDFAGFPPTPTHYRTMTPGQSPSRGLQSKSLMDIRNLIKRAAVPGQPRLVSASVHEPLFKEAAKTWGAHLESFINQTFAFLQAEVMAILDAAFFGLKNRAVYKESLEHMRTFMETHKKELRDQLFGIYRLEAERLCTKDDDTLKRHEADELKILVRHRNHFRIAAHNGEELRSVRKMEELSEEELAQEAAKMAKELKHLGPDQFEKELAVAAYVRGYYLTAANRFVDYVYIHVMSGLMPRVSSVIDTYLHEKLGLTGRLTSELSSHRDPLRPIIPQTILANHISNPAQEVLARLMSEGPEIEQKRRDLRAEKETLDGAMKIIVDLEQREHAASQQQQYYANGAGGASGSVFDASQTDLSSASANGVSSPLDRRTVYSTTAYGDA